MAKKRTEPQLGWGEYYLPASDGRSLESEYAFLMFLEAIHRLAPNVVTSLLAEVSPIYNAVRLNQFGAGASTHDFAPLSTLNELTTLANAGEGQAIELLEKIKSWGQTYRVDSERMYDAALAFLGRRFQRSDGDDLSFDWVGFNLFQDNNVVYPTVMRNGGLQAYPKGMPRYDFSGEPNEYGNKPIDEHICFHYGTHWDPQYSTASDFKQNALAEVSAMLDEFILDVGAYAEEKGLKKAEPFRTLRTHLEWLVKLRILDHSPAKIAASEARVDHDRGSKREPRSEDTIYRGVKAATKLVGLSPIRIRRKTY